MQGQGPKGSGVCRVRLCGVRSLGVRGLHGKVSSRSGVCGVTAHIVSGELPHPRPAPRGGPSVTLDWTMGVFKLYFKY